MIQRIRVSVTDEQGVLLDSCEYDLTKIEQLVAKATAKAKASGRTPVLIARDLATIGDKAGEMVTSEVLAALRRRENERKGR